MDFRRIILILIVALLLTGCKKKQDQETGDEKTITEAASFLETAMPKDLTGNQLVLPVLPEEYLGFSLTWESGQPDVLSNEGHLGLVFEDVTVSFTCHITNGKETKDVTFHYTLKALGDEAILDLLENDIELYQILNDNFPLQGLRDKYRSEIVLTSSKTASINNDGQITLGMDSVKVNLTFTISHGTATRTVVAEVTVRAYTDAEKVNLAADELTLNPNVGKQKMPFQTQNIKYGAGITWESTPAILGNNLFFPNINETVVTLKATLTIGEAVTSKTFEVTVAPVPADKLRAFYMDYVNYLFAKPVSGDFDLVGLEEKYGLEITLESSNPDCLSNLGVYSVPAHDKYTHIRLATDINGEAVVVEKDVVVKAGANVAILDEIVGWLNDEMAGTDINSVKQLPIEHPEHQSYIEWFSYEDGIVGASGQIYDFNGFTGIKPVKLYATVNYNGLNRVVEFEQSITGNQTEFDAEILDRYIQANLPKSVKDVFNASLGTVPAINVDLVALSEHTRPGAKKPFIPQSNIDSYIAQGVFPKGYTVPNEQNILWIVVHETDNWNVGANATMHSNYLKGLAGNASNSTYVSWHYTVDDHQIYQHIPDDERAFHAGDGSTAGGGNYNGIGIEMCVNADGNFEATMKNNAKLIASLLIKYNLSIANVRQHNFFSGKNCPSGIRGSNRWYEFLQMISLEYQAQKIFAQYNVKVTYTINTNSSITYINGLGIKTAANQIYDAVVPVSLIVESDLLTKTYNFDVTVKGKYRP